MRDRKIRKAELKTCEENEILCLEGKEEHLTFRAKLLSQGHYQLGRIIDYPERTCVSIVIYEGENANRHVKFNVMPSTYCVN